MTDRSSEVIVAIVDGDADENLEGIINAARQRERAVAFKRAATLKVGDRVRLTGNLKPKYLLGLEGEIASAPDGDRIAVKLDEEHAAIASRFGNPVRVPVVCVEEVG